jgi:hypothetical protein
VTRRTGIAQIIMLTTIATTGSRNPSAADWSGLMEASADGGYVTNPQLLPHSEVTDESAVLTADGTASMQTERAQLTLTPRVSLTRYLHNPDLDYTVGSIDLNSLEKFERGQLTVIGQVLTDSTLVSELGLTGATRVNRRHDDATLSVGYQFNQTERLSWLLQGSGQVTRYSDSPQFGLVNYTYGSVQFGPTWNLTERVQGSLMLEADRIIPQDTPNQNAFSAVLQLKRNFTEQYSWRVSVGASKVEEGSTDYGTTPVYQLGATRQGERVQWDVSIGRSVVPIGFGLLARSEQATLSLSARSSEHSTITLTFSGIRSAPVVASDFLVYPGASWGQLIAQWKYNFTQHWALSVTYLGAQARNGNLAELGISNQGRLGILWQSGRI